MQTWFGKETVRDPSGDVCRFPLKPFAIDVQLVCSKPGRVDVSTVANGEFSFSPTDLSYDEPLSFLDGRVIVEKTVATVHVDRNGQGKGGIRYNDFPSVCTIADGTAFVAYATYTGRDESRIRLESEPDTFEFLNQPACNDQLFVVEIAEGEPGNPVAISEPGIDIFRPAIAASGSGRIAVFWSQNTNEGWHLFASERIGGRWKGPARLTTDDAPNIHAAAVGHGDSIFVAWQHFENAVASIKLGRLSGNGDCLEAISQISDGSADCWTPAIAADDEGNLAIAYDTYEKGDFDIVCARVLPDGSLQGRVSVAESLKYEAKASVAFDKENRLWVVWEEGGERWAKDFTIRPLKTRSGEPIEYQRSIRIACIDGSRLLEPSTPVSSVLTLQQEIRSVFGSPVRERDTIFLKSRRYAFCPKLVCDAEGTLSLIYREHDYIPDKAFVLQNIWSDYITTYENNRWGKPVRVSGSDGFRHSYPAVRSHGVGGIAVAVSGDGRGSLDRLEASRNQNVSFGLYTPVSTPVDSESLHVIEQQSAPVDETVAAERVAIRHVRDYRSVVACDEYRILRGDYHRHTTFSSDGAGDDGAIEDAFRYALDAADLDTMSNGDHDNGGFEYPWYITQKHYDLYTIPGRFVPMFGYERSRGENSTGGHINVIMPRRGVRVLPGFGIEETDESGSVRDTRMLYRFLRETGSVSIPHTIGTHAGPNFADYAPDVEPAVEIYQGCRHAYEYPDCPRGIGEVNGPGFLWSLLKSGKRYGVISGSDHHSTHMSYGMLYVTQMSRDSALEALRKRHCYAATDNILLDVRVGNDYMMGDEIASVEPTAKLHGERRSG